MTPPMTPREKVAELIYDRLGIGSENQSVEQVSVDILTALASGSGDHAELARAAEAAAPYWHAANLACGGNPIAVDLVAPFVGAMSPAVCSALLAENAALRADQSGWTENYDRATRLHAATCRDLAEAERKLAEAVGLLKEYVFQIETPELLDEARTFLSKEAERG